MSRKPDERISNEIGREICRRKGVKALIEGSIAPLGSHYVLTLQAVNAASGESIGRVQVEAESKERVLHALGDAATQLRRKLGESLASVSRFDAPLVQGTTSSLEALQAYSAGVRANRAGRLKESLAYQQRAVELDPNFALALNGLGLAYYNLGQRSESKSLIRRSFELRNRVSEVERLKIESWYYRLVDSNPAKRLVVLESLTRNYPREAFGWVNLGGAYSLSRQYEKALAAYREGHRLEQNSIGYVMLGFALTRLNRIPEARAVLEEAVARHMEYNITHTELYDAAFLGSDRAAMQREIDWLNANGHSQNALNKQAGTEEYFGRVRNALEIDLRNADNLLNSRSLGALTAVYGFGAQRDAAIGRCAEALANGRKALEYGRNVPALRGPAFAAASCGQRTLALQLVEEMAKRGAEDTDWTEGYLPALRALAELRGGHAGAALPPLGVLLTDSSLGPFPRYVRGEAFLAGKKSAEAAAEFQWLVDNRAEDPENIFHSLAYLGLARAAALAGDRAASRQHYEQFFTIWKDADADLPVLLDAKREFAKLDSGR
jgi:tetratricopeptide (TPR) repeat protein